MHARPLAASRLARTARRRAHAAILLDIGCRRGALPESETSRQLSSPPILRSAAAASVACRLRAARVAHAFIAAMGCALRWARACALLAALGAVAAQNPERASPTSLREAPGSFFRSPGVESLFNIVSRAAACGARLPRGPRLPPAEPADQLTS